MNAKQQYWDYDENVVEFPGDGMNHWKEAIVSEHDSIQRTIEVLNQAAIRAVLVVGQNMSLQGIVTDGDIRRGLLNRIDLSEKVTSVMNQSPVTCDISDSKQTILHAMDSRGLLHMPILESGRLVDFVTVQGYSEAPRYDNPVFLMAGGFGTRLRPLTNDCPKPLLKLGKKPILETILENFISSGFHRFYISTHYLPEKIMNHFGDGSRWNVTIEYVHEEEPLGTGGALGLLPTTTSQLPLIMMNGDILTKVDFAKLLDFHQSSDSSATLCVTEFKSQIPYGVIETDGGHIISIVEKPISKSFINAGIYVLDANLVNTIKPNQSIDMPDLLQRQLEKNEKVAMFPLHEYWLDIGRVPDFEQAQQDFVGGF